MRRIYFLVDLSVLRGAQRPTHLDDLISVVSRTWAAYHQPDITFGYTLFDSSIGDSAMTADLRTVAKSLGLRLDTTSTDLEGKDLHSLLTLIDKLTDEDFLHSSCSVRARRNSRTGQLPSLALKNALQAAVGSGYLQKLQRSEALSASGDSEAAEEGVILAVVPPIAGDAGALFVSKESFKQHGGVMAALLHDLPPKLRLTCASLTAKFCWLAAEGGDLEEADAASTFIPLQATLQKVFPEATALQLAAAAKPSLARAEFAALVGLPQEEEAATGASTSDERWPGKGASLEALAALVAALNGTKDDGKGKLRVAARGSRHIARSKPAAKDAAGGGDGGVKNFRGQKLVQALQQQRGKAGAAVPSKGPPPRAPPLSARASAQPPRRPSAAAKQVLQAPLGQQALASVEALDQVQAVGRLSVGIDALVQREVAEKAGIAAAGPRMAAAVKDLVAAAFASHAAYARYKPDDALDMGQFRAFLGPRCLSVKELKEQRSETKLEGDELLGFAWRCASQVLLRLYINAQAPTVSLNDGEFEKVHALLNLVVSTMPPIPSSGHEFMKEVVAPAFNCVLRDDIRRLEIEFWAEEDSDGDGDLESAHDAQQASIEAIGESPGVANIVARQQQQQQRAVAGGSSLGGSFGVALARQSSLPRAAGGAQQQQRGSVSFVAHSAQHSGEGSGIKVSTSAATAAAAAARAKGATSKLPEAKFLDRYNSSKTYMNQVPIAPPAGARSKQQQLSATATSGRGGGESRRGKARAAAAAAAPSFASPVADRRKTVPDTPEGEAGGENDEAGERRERGGEGGVASPRCLFSPPHRQQRASLDAVPDTSPREQRAAARTAGLVPTAGGVCVLRQPSFDLGPSVPGAIVNPSQRASQDDGMVDEDVDIGETQIAPPQAMKNTWFATAVVPKGRNGHAAPARAPMLAMDDLLGARFGGAPVVEAAAAADPGEQAVVAAAEEFPLLPEPAAAAPAEAHKEVAAVEGDAPRIVVDAEMEAEAPVAAEPAEPAAAEAAPMEAAPAPEKAPEKAEKPAAAVAAAPAGKKENKAVRAAAAVEAVLRRSSRSAAAQVAVEAVKPAAPSTKKKAAGNSKKKAPAAETKAAGDLKAKLALQAIHMPLTAADVTSAVEKLAEQSRKRGRGATTEGPEAAAPAAAEQLVEEAPAKRPAPSRPQTRRTPAAPEVAPTAAVPLATKGAKSGSKKKAPAAAPAAVESTPAAHKPATTEAPPSTRRQTRHSSMPGEETPPVAATVAAVPVLSSKGKSSKKQHAATLELPAKRQTRHGVNVQKQAAASKNALAAAQEAPPPSLRQKRQGSAAAKGDPKEKPAADNEESESPAGAVAVVAESSPLPAEALLDAAATPAAAVDPMELFQQILAADVVMPDAPAEEQAGEAPAPAAVVEPPTAAAAAVAATPAAARPPRPPPVLAPEALLPPSLGPEPFIPLQPAVAATPLVAAAPAPAPSAAKTASVLGKRPSRSLAALKGRTPASRHKGRLAGMLPKGKHRPVPALRPAPVAAAAATPSQQRFIEDLNSPNKPSNKPTSPRKSPSPYSNDWDMDLPGTEGTGEKVLDSERAGKFGGTSRKRLRMSGVGVGAKRGGEQQEESTGESTGDAPGPEPARKLQLESDEEDEEILQKAAAGGLSPAGSPAAIPEIVVAPAAAAAVAAKPTANYACVLETTPQEPAALEVAATPQSRNPRAEVAEKARGTKSGTAAPVAARQLHMTRKLAAAQDKTVVVTDEGVPGVGDTIRWGFSVMEGIVLPLVCRVVDVLSFSRVARGGWECEVEIDPEASCDVAAMKVVLRSSAASSWSAVEKGGQWSLQGAVDMSPEAPAAHPAAPPAETVKHNAAARTQGREREDSMDSVPVLPQTALRAVFLRTQAKTDGPFLSPRVQLRPTHLNMDQAAAKVVAAGELAMAPPMAALSAQKESLGSGGSGCARGLMMAPSPQALDAAAGMLGTLYTPR